MKFSVISGKKHKNTVLTLFIVIVSIALGILYFSGEYLFNNGKPAYSIGVKTEKTSYLRGENIKFTVINEGARPVWFIVPPSKCKSGFNWTILKGSDEIWNAEYKYPKCDIGKEDYDFIEVKILNPGERMDGLWDQKLFSDSIGSSYTGYGKYKIAFYYSSEIINKVDAKNGSDPNMKSTDSLEFEITGDPYSDSIKSEIQKENDAKRKSDLKKIKQVLEAYYQQNSQSYPDSNGFLKLDDSNSDVYRILSERVDEGSVRDPNYPEFYYGYSSDGSSFELSARLESDDDDSCEILGESLCIYKIDSLGNVSRKKYEERKVLTIGESVDAFIAGSGIFNESNDVIMITSDSIGSEEEAMIKEANTPENVKIIKAGEVGKEELSKNNLVLIGSPASNSLIKELYRKVLITEIADSIDFEKNSIKSALGFVQNPWNDQKNILIVDLGYSFGSLVRLQGDVKSEKIGAFYHIVFRSKEGEAYALIQSFENNNSRIGNMNDFDGKNVEVYGYKRISDSKEFPIEESLGVIDMNIMD